MNKVLIVLVTAAVVGGLAFWGGTMFSARGGQGNYASGQGMFAAGVGRGQGGAGAAGAGFRGGMNGTAGTIMSKDDTSMTVKLADGGSKIVFYSATTPVIKTTEGSASDLTVGEAVAVQGTTNADGSVTAKTVQIRPAMPVGTPVGGSLNGASSTANNTTSATGASAAPAL